MRAAQHKRACHVASTPDVLDAPNVVADAAPPPTQSTNQASTAQQAAAAQPPPVAYIGTLLVQCPDQKGVIASLAQLLFGFGCNIVESDQFTDVDATMFFQRIRFDYSALVIGVENIVILEKAVRDLAKRYDMDWKVQYDWQTPNVAILVSKMDHCLYDLLIRHKSGELRCNIPIIISNHPDLGHISTQFGIEFVHLPVASAARAGASKEEQEAQIEAILQERSIDLVVLARYMQIFSPGFCARNWRRTINIHHSFLPAFEGAKPYHRAHERGVKIIGATAHYATSELDAGPIIEQDITRITHRDMPRDMIRKGRDLERLVLARAVRSHLQLRVLVHNNKTVVFED
jgi:formyltetrahydrofolate deformylase